MSLLRLVVVVIAAALFLGTEINDKFSEVGNTDRRRVADVVTTTQREAALGTPLSAGSREADGPDLHAYEDAPPRLPSELILSRRSYEGPSVGVDEFGYDCAPGVRSVAG
jgi:hypothetical protein